MFKSRFITKNDNSFDSIHLGCGQSFDFSELQKERGRSWHSRPYEYAFVDNGLIRAFEHGMIRLDRILDLACGTYHPGYMAIANIERVKRVIALDVDEALLINHMDHRKVYKTIGFADNTLFKGESYDAISCVSALEHMLNWKNCIKEMYRLLKPGGMVFATVDISTDQSKTAQHGVDNKRPADYANEFALNGFDIGGDYDDHLPIDAVDAICSKYPLAASESELMDGQHRDLKTFRMVLRKEFK